MKEKAIKELQVFNDNILLKEKLEFLRETLDLLITNQHSMDEILNTSRLLDEVILEYMKLKEKKQYIQ